MKNFYFFICLCFPILLSASVFAQDAEPLPVPVRISDNGEYTRIVFGWNTPANYTLERTEGDIKIKFKQNATLNTNDINAAAGKNIAQLKLLSTAPLEVSFNIPASSKLRDFNIGKRVVIDVYNPDNPKDALAQSAPAPAKAEPEKPAEVQKSETPPAVPPAIVLVPENLPDPNKEKSWAQQQSEEQEKLKAEEAEKKENLKRAVKQDNHVISLNTTSVFGMAVFEQFNDLWLVIDDTASLALPSLSSPTPERFGDVQMVQSPESKIYKIQLPSDEKLFVQGKGGGLSWEIIMGDKVKEQEPAPPIINADGTITVPVQEISKILSIINPSTGQNLFIVTSQAARYFGAHAQSFAEFDLLRSPIGLAIYAKVDDLQVKRSQRGIEITRADGLSLAPQKEIDAANIFKAQTKDEESKRKTNPEKQTNNLYKFSDWKLGEAGSLIKNETLILSSLNEKSESRRIESLITLGKMMLSHGLASESLGYLSFAQDDLPELSKSAEFKAIRGAANALAWHSDEALVDLLDPALQNEDEVKFFTAYVLADLGDWQQAAQVLPAEYRALYDYPPYIAHRLALALAEINLRAGQIKPAEELLALVDHDENEVSPPNKAALEYLRGEAARQKGDLDLTRELWDKLAKGDDELYKVKATLALTILEGNEKRIDNKETIDRLESIRYSWRGDELEAQVKYWLGNAYVKDKNFLVGLSIMRDAIDIAGEALLAERITTDMTRTYLDLYTGPDLKNISALNAMAIYDQFRELTPIGDQGNKLEQNLAEHLARANLLSHATKLLRHQVDHKLKGEEKVKIALRLAALELIDKNPQKAVNAIGKAKDALETLSDTPQKAKHEQDLELLRIMAYKENKEYDKALSLLEGLEPSQKVNSLKADIAWKAKYWKQSAEALNAVIIDENIAPDAKLTDKQAALILNRAIALSLNDELVSLANMRAKYLEQMKTTNKAEQFNTITRPRRGGALADRETILSAVEEVELFKEFLDSYRQN